jgi:sugar (pentulose or hexulose) kinase
MSLMGLDIGTTGCKAVAFDESGRILALHYEEYPLYLPAADQCEIDPNDFWKAVVRVISATAEKVKLRDPVVALGISTLGDSLMLLDRKGKPLHRTVVGAADTRSVKQASWIDKQIGRKKVFDTTGVPLHAFSVVPKIMWFRENMPEIFNGVKKFVGVQEFAHIRLGVAPAIDYSLAGRTMLVNIHTREWATDILEKCGVDVNMLSSLVGSSQVVGRLDSYHARQLNLRGGVSIIAGGFDQCCSALGAGVLDSSSAALSVGTLEAVVVVYDKPRIEIPLLNGNHGCSFYIIDGLFISLAYVTTAGAILKWYRDTLGETEVQKARELNLDPYDVMIHSTPDRPAKVFIFPYFTGTGTPWLDLKKRGMVFGLSLDTDRAEIIKGILDGICYEVKVNLDSFRKAGIRVNRLQAVGGGAKSDRWMQLKADITGVPVQATKVTEAGCLGAAFLAGLGTGIYTSADDILEIATIDRVFNPRESHSKLYEESYRNYLDLRASVGEISSFSIC